MYARILNIGAADNTQNIRVFLGRIAKKWYELWALSREQELWQEWGANSLSCFCGSKVQSWNRAITYRYGRAPSLEYFPKRFP